MPISTMPSTSVQVTFHDKDGVKNTNYTGQLSDNRNAFGLTINGDTTAVLTAQVFVDRAEATDTATLKSFKLRMMSENNIGTSLTVATNDIHYNFIDGENYAIKIKLVLNSANFTTLYAKFTVSGGTAPTPSYNYLHRTTLDTVNATVINHNAIENGSDITFLAPIQFVTTTVDTITITQQDATEFIFTIRADGYNNSLPVEYSIPSGEYTRREFATALAEVLNSGGTFGDLKWTVTYSTDHKLQFTYFGDTINSVPIYFLHSYFKAILIGAWQTSLEIPFVSKKLGMVNPVNAVPKSVNVDSRVPKELLFTFDRYDTSPSEYNDEPLSQYSTLLPYNNTTNVYTCAINGLNNDRKYAASVAAIFDDGHSISSSAQLIKVLAAPKILQVEAYGLGDGSGAGDAMISTVMNVTLATQESAINIHRTDTKITFNLSQGSTLCYKFIVDAKVGINPVYRLLKEDFIRVAEPTPTSTGSGAFMFDVSAVRTYSDSVVKTSNIVSATFTSDMIGISSVQINNAWVQLSDFTLGGNKWVEFDSVLTQANWNSIPETAVAGKFSKNDFFGSGLTGVYSDADVTSTKFKFQVSQDGGATFAPVKKLRMKQGANPSSRSEDRAKYTDLLDDVALENNDGLYNNIPWPAVVPGSQQSPFYFIAECDPAPALAPGIRSLNGVSTTLTDAEMTTVKADSTLAVTTTGTGVNGWAIKNGAAPVVNGVVTGPVPKVNLYYYANAVAAASQTSSNSFTLSQAGGLGLYAVFNQNSGAKQYPFFIAYTTPTAADNKSSWYKSKVFYAPASGSPLNAGLTLAYSGTDNLSFLPEIPAERRVKYEVNLGSSNANAGYNDELVNMLSLQTSGNATSTNAGDFDFQLLETGMKTNNTSFGLVSLKYNVYSENNLVLAISIEAHGYTKPFATRTTPLKIMNKVNQSTGSEPLSTFKIKTNTLTVRVDNNFATSNDYMTGVLFKSNLNAPNNFLTVPVPAGNASNIFSFEISPLGRVGVNNPCTYQLSYIVKDAVQGHINGPLGLPVSIVLATAPTQQNYVISNLTYKTINDDDESSCTFDVAFNNANSANILGLDVTFSTKSYTTNVGGVQGTVRAVNATVTKIVRGTTDVQTVTILFSDKPWFNSWPNFEEAGLLFTPYYLDDGEIVDETNASSFITPIHNVLKIDSTPALLKGGVVESADGEGASLRWDKLNWSYDLLDGVNNVSNSIAYGGKAVYTIPNLTAGSPRTLKLKKKVTLSSRNFYGPITIVTFTPVSVNTTTMVLSVKRGSDNTQLWCSHAQHTTSDETLLNVTATELVVGETPLVYLGAGLLQPPTVTNKYNLTGYALGTNLALRMRVKAGVAFSVKVGALAVQALISEATYLNLFAPVTHYIVAGPPKLTIADYYTVQNWKINIPFNMDANGLHNEGLSGVTAIITQDSDLTEPTDANSGKGGTVLVTFSPDSNVLIPGIRGLNGVSTNLTDAEMTTVKADSTLTVTTVLGVNGWAIKNGAAPVVNGVVTGAVPKVNLYYYKNAVAAASQTSSNSFTLSQAGGLGLYAVFNQNSGAKQYPFFIAYTTPTAADNKSSWYKSKVFYAPASGSPLNAGLTLAYSGTDNLSFLPEIPAERRVKYEVNLGSSNANAGYNDELVNMLSLQTSGNATSTNAGDFDFQLLETGMKTNNTSFGLVSLKYNVYSDYSRTVYGYELGPSASATVATDYLAANEVRTTRPENLSNGANAIESGDFTLTLHSLTAAAGESKLTCPTNGFIQGKPISVVMIAHTRLGTAVSIDTLDYVVGQTLTVSSVPTPMVVGSTDSLNLSTAVTSDNTDPNARPVTFSVSFEPAGCGTYNSTTKVITAGSEFGTITVTADQAGYTNSSGPVLAATNTFTVKVSYITFDGTTYKFNGSLPSGAAKPFLTKGPGDLYYAVIGNDNTSKQLARNYIRTGDDIDGRFRQGSEQIPPSRIVTTLMTDMGAMMYEVQGSPDITRWDTSNVTSMASMFTNSTFNLDISHWNVDKVTSFSNFRSGGSLSIANTPHPFR